jgi:hypothetical protein
MLIANEGDLECHLLVLARMVRNWTVGAVAEGSSSAPPAISIQPSSPT